MSLHYCFTCEHSVSTKEVESSHKGHSLDTKDTSAFYLVRVFIESLLRETSDARLVAER